MTFSFRPTAPPRSRVRDVGVLFGHCALQHVRIAFNAHHTHVSGNWLVVGGFHLTHIDNANIMTKQQPQVDVRVKTNLN